MTIERRRISIDVEADFYERYTEAIPWGLRKKVMLSLARQIVEMVEQEGQSVLGEFISSTFTIKDIREAKEKLHGNNI